MPSHRLTTLCTVTALSLAQPLQAAPATWTIDPEHTVVAFTIMHAGYAKVLGRFSDVEGSFVYDPETQELGEVSATIGAQSVDTDHEKRDNHVRSGDFLDAEAHPDITFAATGATATSETTGTVTGDLTVRGVTQPVTLDVTLNKRADYPCCHGKETLGISATTEIMRSDFGSTYALPEFVGDAVSIMLEFEAIRAE
ncbi:YceI family protein [uncultured Roseovarius sp.]|uniref:YceI family protein n=1 Tax=uncultured Roseovarius sp. TaxID=293344 RepID=UPI00260B3171|nr:YceI family protein [uncultured Roseovarius sp.]